MQKLLENIRRVSVINYVVLFMILFLLPVAIVMILPLFLMPEYFSLFPSQTDAAVLATARATIGLTLATVLLAVVATASAWYAANQVNTAMKERSADFTLRLHDGFHGDRGLRIRHGAVMFLQQERRKDPSAYTHDLDWSCRDKHISPYFEQTELSSGLNADLIDVLNFLDRVAYMALDAEVIDKEMAMDRFGMKVKGYCEACGSAIDTDDKWGSWEHLRKLYTGHEQWREERGIPTKKFNPQEINEFLKIEHVRSHRGSAC